MKTDQLLEQVAAIAEDEQTERAPARLKSKIYSAVVAHLATEAPLLGLAETKAAGGRLCIFEEALAALPLPDEVGSKNPCRICHARVLAERLEWAPIFWTACPYSEFHND